MPARRRPQTDTINRLESKGFPSTEAMLQCVCDGLKFGAAADGIEWKSLPGWVRFLIQVGSRLHLPQQSEARTFAAIVVPTRAYAASFLALGTVIAGFASSAESQDGLEHARKLRSMAVGTPVTLVRDNRRLKGVFLGFKVEENAERAGVQVENQRSGGLSHWLPPRSWVNIQPTSKTDAVLPAHQKGSSDEPGEMITVLLGKSQARHYVLDSQLECVVVGRVNILQHEIDHTPFCFEAGDSRWIPGSLQEILRVRRFLGESVAYRSDVLSIESVASTTSSSSPTPLFVIFDGSRAYLKCHHLWPDSHAAVILDRTENCFHEAAQMVNQDFVQRRIGNEWSEGKLPPVPGGIEVMVYEEPRR